MPCSTIYFNDESSAPQFRFPPPKTTIYTINSVDVGALLRLATS